MRDLKKSKKNQNRGILTAIVDKVFYIRTVDLFKEARHNPESNMLDRETLHPIFPVLVQTIEKQVNDLRIVKVTFNSPMLLQITRNIKINFVGKLSTIGGNLGLFTGFNFVKKILFEFFSTVSLIFLLKKHDN